MIRTKVYWDFPNSKFQFKDELFLLRQRMGFIEAKNNRGDLVNIFDFGHRYFKFYEFLFKINEKDTN